ncbi:hypothetical protein P691DRAFT_669262 [Macrolepiota fuliginosa MF-IS2]|uniref:Cation efflux protein transmembrane domain-containing protein n=1 Tax=Macrolepiota fuliginosa MF-IS2 TaxID=1400762 RepID=A0A9P5XEY0_9AGAR|nr:hypothetical protein P691DRAFT_669262 [Macrolepiota fuliginosa MF-IS2]
MPSYHKLQQYAIAISIVSVIYNGAEGGVSIGLGAEAGSRSLIFFGIQSAVEVLSAILVLWRFRKVAKPGEERRIVLLPDHLKFEKWGTFGIGALLVILSISTEATSITTLIHRDVPNLSNSSLIVSATALVFMILIWLPKRYLAKALNSSVMQGEATCSLSCIQLTLVLFAGSLLFKVWKGGWWVDSATAIVLGLFFAWEGVKMIRWWSGSSEFTGGCCGGCHDSPSVIAVRAEAAELGQVYRDVCSCCLGKEGCRSADECKCSGAKPESGKVLSVSPPAVLLFYELDLM